MTWTPQRVAQALKLRCDRVIRSTLDASLSGVPLSMWQKLDRRKLYGIFYHLVSPVHLPHIATYAYKTPAQFRDDLIYLKTHFQLPTYNELREQILSGKPFSEPTAFVSFDDGLRECLDLAAPVLKEVGVPAIFFVNSDFLDNRKMFYRHKASLCMDKIKSMSPEALKPVSKELNFRFNLKMESGAQLWSWIYELTYKDEHKIQQLCELMQVDWREYLNRRKPYLSSDGVLEMERQGFVIGAHTRDHKLLSLVDSEKEITREIVESCEDVSRRTGRRQVPFAFPFHGRGIRMGLLQEILQKHEVVDLIFEATGIGMKAPKVVRRLWGDPPPESAGTNLPLLMAKEYVRQIY